ncbi:MAG: hypothetical protein JNM24_01090 [Bdellovibrionaceae bacterium]|nr:hypothetical protein [Pseudobdellovibrionaceae bacterium]
MFKILLFLALCTQFAFAYVVSNDDDYYIYHSEGFSYILTKSDFKYLPRIIGQSRRSQLLFEKEFSWKLDERTSLVVTSNKNQVANAFATISPNNMVVFYKGGVEFLDPSSSSSWIDTLSSHELAHVYQLNAKNQLGIFLKKIFGNQTYLPIPVFPWPIFISPTALLPTFLVEGNAVLNESRLNQGGRLMSGESLVLATELNLSGKADLSYMMNSTLEFPYGKEKYIVGGYFQSFLANTYGFPVTNRFFIHHAENNINPFDLKSSFAATFFEEYEDLYKNFQYSLKTNQKKYNAYRGKSLMTSLSAVDFKRIDSSIYFISVFDGKTPNSLNRFDIETKRLASEKTYLNLGRVYRNNNTFYTAGSYSQHQRNTFYTLVDKDYNFVPAFKDKYITDIEGNHVSYFDMNQSFDRGVLYRNHEKISETESKALLDKDGNIFYFKQEQNSKVLYKNQDRLASIESYYALLVDVISTNEIYFISNTETGSGLFCYCENQMKRVLPYDNVLNATKAGTGFLVSVLNSDRYHVAYIEQLPVSNEAPFNIRTQFPENYFKPHIPISEVALTGSPQPYFSLREMRFSTYSMNLFYSTKHATLINTFNWVDPLFYSDLSVSFSVSNKLAYNSFNYQYTPYATKIAISAENETEFYFDETQKFTTNSIQIGLKNVLWDTRNHSFSMGLDLQADKNEVFKNEIGTAYFSYQYIDTYFLNYLPYTYFAFTPSIEKSSGQVSQSYSLTANKKLFYDLYVSLGFSKNDSEYFKLEADSSRKTNFFRRGLGTPLHYATLFTSKVTQSDIEFIYDVPYSKYFYRFPISLRRLAPFIGYQENHSDEFFYRTEIDEITFATAGLEAELLVFHTNPTRVRLLSSEIEIRDKSETRLGIEIKTEF